MLSKLETTKQFESAVGFRRTTSADETFLPNDGNLPSSRSRPLPGGGTSSTFSNGGPRTENKFLDDALLKRTLTVSMIPIEN